MKKLTNKTPLALNTETIKVLSPQRLVEAAGGRWYESWSLCDGGSGSYETGYGCGGSARG
jgi:hypothetical protein